MKATPLLSAAAAAALILSVSGAAGATHHVAPAQPRETAIHVGGVVNVGIDSDPETFDPTEDATLGEEQVLVSLYDTPLQIGPTGSIEPDLVTSWQYITPTDLTLHLRHGVSYTDGTPFNATSARFDLLRQASATSSYRALYSDVASFTAAATYTLQVHLKAPDSAFLEALAGRGAYMVSPTAVAKYGSKFGLHPVGTGPFVLSSYTANSTVVLTRNPNYWLPGHPYLDGVTYHIITDDTTKTVAVVSGQLQTEDYVEPIDVTRAENQPGLTVSKWTGTLTPYIPMNYHVKPLNDPTVREAISLAINRQSLAANVFLGDANPANSMLASAYSEYDSRLPVPATNVHKALQLLDGRKFTLTMQVPPTYVDESQVIKQQLAAVGITLQLQNMDWTTLVNNFYKNDFQLQAEDVTAQWPDAELLMGGFFLSTGDYNGLGFTDPVITRALDAAQLTDNESVIKSDFATAQAAAWRDNIYVPLVWVDNLRVSSSNLHGVPEEPDGFLMFRDAWLG